MERKAVPVKQRRSYDSPRRQEQARQTRQAILDVARRRFLDVGFTSTTIAAIASEVGVSVDTIYKTFGGKPGLVKAICEQALAGEGPVHAEIRSDALQVTEPDPRVIMRGIGKLAAEVAPRVAPIILLVRDAALTDPDMAALKSDFDDQRLERMTHNAHNLSDAGHLREGLSVEEAGEIMWTYSSEELYELLVIKRGWSVDRFGGFIAATLTAALLPLPTNDGARRFA
jgi:AcrR family transcriptional regulator